MENEKEFQIGFSDKFNYKGWLARNGEYYPIKKLDNKEVDDGR